MLYRVLRKISYFLSAWVYFTMAGPLLVLVVPWIVYSLAKYRSLNGTPPILWAGSWQWPNFYLKIVSKITGYYP